VNPRHARSVELGQPLWADLDQVRSSRHRISPKARDVDAVAHVGERLQQADPVIELHRCAVKVPIYQQVVHANPDLQDSLVQVPNLALGRPPQQLQRLVLLEKLTRVELVNGLREVGWCGFGAGGIQVSGLEPVERALQLRVLGSGVGRGNTERYTGWTILSIEKGDER
jgi:hypothetical protein